MNRAALEAEAVDFLRELLRIPSINPPGGELAAAVAVQALLQRCGIASERIDLATDRASVVAHVLGAGEALAGIGGASAGRRRTLALSGHLDVVPPGEMAWKHPPFAAEVHDGRIYGRGASDMKSGLAALVFALISLQRQGVRLAGDVRLLATCGEEAGALGAKQLAASGWMDGVDALVIGEPTRDQIFIAHKGAFWVQVTCYGKTAHGAMPELGVNAIVHMHRVIDLLLRDFRMEEPQHPLLGQPTSNLAVIRGGVGTNVVPDRCSLEIDLRTLPSQRHPELLRQLEDVVAAAQSQWPGLRADVRVLNDLPPVQTDPEDAFVTLVRGAVEEVCGQRPALKGVNFYTDAAALCPAGSGTPVVIVGPGDDRLAHQPDESVEIDAFLRAIRYYERIAEAYLGSGGESDVAGGS